MYSEDYPSFRVLFLVETMGLLDTWREPTPEELTAILRHIVDGGRVAVRIDNIIDLFQPVWPLEVAKYEYLVHRATWDNTFRKRYFMTAIRSYATALVQTWWAFETLMNDFAGIIAKERGTKLDAVTDGLLKEQRPTLNKAGGVAFESYYQPLLPRLQFIYRFLTGDDLDRSSGEWCHLVTLKEERDAYVHRIGKEGARPQAFGSASIVADGFSAVRGVLANVLVKTPEFADRFAYKYLAFWSCGLESPIIWDGSEGDTFYLGLGSVDKEAIVRLFAPMPGSFGAEKGAFPSVGRGDSMRP